MTVDSESIGTTSASSVVCGACSTENPSESRFCAGCGHALYENCPGCSKPVAYTQAFCGGCGENLKASLQKRRDEFTARLATAVDAAKKSEFDRALSILGSLSENADYRFKDLAKDAKQAHERVVGISGNLGSIAEEALQRAKPFIEQRNHEAIIETLKDVPEKLLDEATAKAFRTARETVARREELFAACQVALKERDWVTVGALVSQLADLNPEEEQFQKLGRKVGAKLVGRAQKLLDQARYKRALESLDSVPSFAQDETYDQTRHRISDILWLREQLDLEPFDTPLLGRLAVALGKLEPNNKENQKTIQKIASNLKTGKRIPRGHFPNRLASPVCWLNCPFTHLANLTLLPSIEDPKLRSFAGRFNIAFGLALQGIGKAKIDQNLIEKKGLFSSLKRRKDDLAWGIDVGSTSIKAVALRQSDGNIEVADAFVHEFESALDDANSDTFGVELSNVLEGLREKHELDETPVWSNIPARHVISRFSILPPVADKQAKELIDREINTRIPVELDTLVVQHTLEPLQTAESGEIESGRALLITATKKQVVELHSQAFADAGLNLVGLQTEPTALINLMHHEFASELDPSDADPDDSDTNSDSEAQGEEDTLPKHPAIALIHSGAESTTVAWVAKDSQWFWTVENGGNDLVGLIARQSKVTRDEAKQLLRNPHDLPVPSSDYALVESRLDELRSRIQKVVTDNISEVSRFEIKACYASGGNTFNHQWMRRMLLANLSTNNPS